MLLSVEKIDFFYGDVQVLYGVSLELDKNEIVTLVGSNGAGKTSTLRAISNIGAIKSGAITYEGQRLDTVPAHRLAYLGISLVPEGRHLFPAMTVQDNLKLGGLALKDGKAVAAGLEMAYEMFPRLKERRSQLAGTLSGGEQQMCAIARGLMINPKLIIFDEPSLGLAPNLVDEIFVTLKKLIHARDASVLLVEQNAQSALEISDRGYVLENGHIVLSGNSKDLINDPKVRTAYLGL